MSALIILNASDMSTSKDIITSITTLLQLHWDCIVYVSSFDAPIHADLLEPVLYKQDCIEVHKAGFRDMKLETALKARGIMAVTVCGFTDVMETARDASIAGFKTMINAAGSPIMELSIMDKQMLWANCITVI